MSKPMRVPVWTWRDAVRQADVPPLTKLVCWALANYITDLGEGCFPSVESLMRDTGLSNRSIATHTANAVAAGLLEVDPRRAPGGKFMLNVYLPRFPDHCDLARPDDRTPPREGGSHGKKTQVKEVHSVRPRDGGSHGKMPPREENDVHRVNLLHTNCPKGTNTTPPTHIEETQYVGGCEKDLQHDNPHHDVLDRLGKTCPDVVAHCLRPITDLIRVQHAQPALLLEEVARRLAGEPVDVLRRTAEVLVEQRTVLVAPRNVLDALAAARQLVREAQARPEGVTITRDGTPEQWAAWRRHAEANRRSDRAMLALARIMDIASQATVPTLWPEAGPHGSTRVGDNAGRSSDRDGVRVREQGDPAEGRPAGGARAERGSAP